MKYASIDNEFQNILKVIQFAPRKIVYSGNAIRSEDDYNRVQYYVGIMTNIFRYDDVTHSRVLAPT